MGHRFQESRDANADERALLDGLELDPDNAEAQHNLQLLHRPLSWSSS
jgi:hypothetical protein